MKIATWNINSIRRRLPLLLDWLGRHQPDIMCLQETKVQDSAFPVDALREAILRNPNDVNLYLEFAAIAEKHQSVEVGINVVNDGLNLQPNAAALYFARGMLYVQLSEYEKAQLDFDKAYQLDPSLRNLPQQ